MKLSDCLMKNWKNKKNKKNYKRLKNLLEWIPLKIWKTQQVRNNLRIRQYLQIVKLSLLALINKMALTHISILIKNHQKFVSEYKIFSWSTKRCIDHPVSIVNLQDIDIK